VEFDGSYFCPHHPRATNAGQFSGVCRCRKPRPGMAEQAALDLGIDIRRSVVVGDSKADIDLARVLGSRAVLVRTGYGRGVESALTGSSYLRRIPVHNSLAEAVSSL
ncbi:MAG: HAD-IIIA family hydrolase, partial [candidate division Zixibacteria bacterium]|nr:HAD-IIIA family hydrolase [candidate division Zixibacteria bacterium]